MVLSAQSDGGGGVDKGREDATECLEVHENGFGCLSRGGYSIFSCGVRFPLEARRAVRTPHVQYAASLSAYP